MINNYTFNLIDLDFFYFIINMNQILLLEMSPFNMYLKCTSSIWHSFATER